MDSQPSGNNQEIISIESDNLYFVIKGNEDSIGTSDEDSVFITSFCEHLNTSFNPKVHLKEYKNYEVIIISKHDAKLEFYHDNQHIRNKVTPMLKGSNNLSGIINFRGDIGYTDFIVKANGHDEFCCRTEVYPSKISYKKDYEEILRDVNEEIYNLAYGFLARTYLGAEISNKTNSSKTEFYSILNYVFEKLKKSMDVVINNPHHKLEKENLIVKYDKLKNVTNDTIKWLEKRPHMNGIEALQTKKTVTTNTKENRFVKFMLVNIIKKIDEFTKVYKNSNRYGTIDEVVLDKLNIFRRTINTKINSSFLKDIPAKYNEASMSLVFTMGSGYREIYKYYLMLQKGLNINSNVMTLSIKELSELYEYWCFIKINSLLQKKYKLISADFLKIHKTGINVSLIKGDSSCLKYKNPRTGETFEVLYNRGRLSKTVAQKPDNILSINKDGSEKAYEFIFDAKYKIDTTEDYKEKYHGVGPKTEDINTMHRYRDAIVYENKKTKANENCIFGAFVLFPYNNEEEFRNHDFYKSIEEVNIGAIPFLPSSTKLMEEFLEELINESSYSTFERALDQVGKEEHLKDEYFTKRNVLVGPVKDYKQLEVSLQERFYHVPKSSVNLIKHNIEYVALAQSIKAFKEEAGITYYGKVESIQEVKRNEITEIPKSSDELYYLIKISEWIKLPKKIEVMSYPVRRCLYTSYYLIKASKSVAELFIKTKEEYRAWHELKRFA
ncbi:MAG: DUF2357 domain-containing protein, partial [Clostridium sp.]